MVDIALAILLLFQAEDAASALERGELLPPVKLEANGRPIDVERQGHAAVAVGDVNGDGHDDLLVGEFFEGRMRIFHNRGTNRNPYFTDFEWFRAGGEVAHIPARCFIGCTPQLVDLNGDGRQDVISGSHPGEIYWFRRNQDGTFAGKQQLPDKNGEPLNPGPSLAAFAVDWDDDGDLDLLTGSVTEGVQLVPNIGTKTNWQFDVPVTIEAAGEPIDEIDPAPVAADWDGDGRRDLLLATASGRVLWYRNIGEKGKPMLDKSRVLVPRSPSGRTDDGSRTPTDWGVWAKICVVDWNRDGRLDLLMGDYCGGFEAKPTQTEAERAEEEQARQQLPKLQSAWAATFREYRELLRQKASDQTDRENESDDESMVQLRDKLQSLKREIAAAQDTLHKYRVQRQAHGYVWLFLRAPQK